MTLAALWVDSTELKMLRESLCIAQSEVMSWRDEDVAESAVERIDKLIAEIDRHRPLGTDGTHGNLHTATCGCDR
jgi:hypothetical protein